MKKENQITTIKSYFIWRIVLTSLTGYENNTVLLRLRAPLLSIKSNSDLAAEI